MALSFILNSVLNVRGGGGGGVAGVDIEDV